MNTLRGILGTIAVLSGGGFVFFVVPENPLRKSFGAAGHGPGLLILPAFSCSLLFAAILPPSNKPLLHVAVVAALGFAGFWLWQILGEGGTPLWFLVAYLVAWFVYYWHAARRVVPQR